MAWMAEQRGPWLFIIEGSITLGTGVAVWALLPQFPDQMTGGKSWLFTKDDIQLAIARTASKSRCLSISQHRELIQVLDYNVQGAKISTKQIWIALKDPKFWLFSTANGGLGLALSSVGTFLPTFISDFGYSTRKKFPSPMRL